MVTVTGWGVDLRYYQYLSMFVFLLNNLYVRYYIKIDVLWHVVLFSRTSGHPSWGRWKQSHPQRPFPGGKVHGTHLKADKNCGIVWYRSMGFPGVDGLTGTDVTWIQTAKILTTFWRAKICEWMEPILVGSWSNNANVWWIWGISL